MPVELKVKDIMVPIDDYAVTTTDKLLKKAVPELMQIFSWRRQMFSWNRGNISIHR